MEKAGYIPGKGRTFTPSSNANWIDEFNELLNGSGISRNSLTEELIESGLKLKRNEHLMISTSSLTPGQKELLSSQQGQTILLNVALMLLGNPMGLQQMNLVAPNAAEAAVTVEHPVITKTEGSNNEEGLIATEVSRDEVDDLIQTLPDRLISKSQETDEKKLTPMEKARLKMKTLNQSKGDLRAD